MIDYLLNGYANKELLRNYTIQFSFQIYVPFKDMFFHWFLMVIAVNEKMIFHLDSFLEVLDKALVKQTKKRVVSYYLTRSHFAT